MKVGPPTNCLHEEYKWKGGENLRSQIWGVLTKVVKTGLINGSRQRFLRGREIKRII